MPRINTLIEMLTTRVADDPTLEIFSAEDESGDEHSMTAEMLLRKSSVVAGYLKNVALQRAEL